MIGSDKTIKNPSETKSGKTEMTFANEKTQNYVFRKDNVIINTILLPLLTNTAMPSTTI